MLCRNSLPPKIEVAWAYVSPMGHENNILRHSPSLDTVELQTSLIFEAPNKNFMSEKVEHKYMHTSKHT